MTVNVWWIRRDLRLHDNQALSAALEGSRQVLPLFILDPTLLSSPNVGAKRTAFLFASLRQLDEELKQKRSRLMILRGDPLLVLQRISSRLDLGGIFAEEDGSPYARRRDGRIAKELPLHLKPGLTVHPPGIVRRKDGGTYSVYAPYRDAWLALPPPTRNNLLLPPQIMPLDLEMEGEGIPVEPAYPQPGDFPPGERAARARLKQFTTGSDPSIYSYSAQRDLLDADGTSKLSPYLRFGMLSAREVAVHALEAKGGGKSPAAIEGAMSWLQELIWREFYISILYHHPDVLNHSFRKPYRDFPWRADPSDFQAWKEGWTGFPIVDAAMRELKATGWMHNRARMVVASFLVKDLLLDWRWGERWFREQLIDGDPAANNGGWQWAAGTGTDAAPYFRIFNPVRQGKRFDPQGAYVRRWIPELENVPLAFLHEPWKMPESQQRTIGFNLGKDYPYPLVDHAAARERALQVYGQARDRASPG